MIKDTLDLLILDFQNLISKIKVAHLGIYIKLFII